MASKKTGDLPNYSNPGERTLEILGGELIYTTLIEIIAFRSLRQIAYAYRLYFLHYTQWCRASTRFAFNKWPNDTQNFRLRLPGTGEGETRR